MMKNIENPIILTPEELGLKIIADDEVFVQLDFNKNYLISNHARLYSKLRMRILEPQKYGLKSRNNDYNFYRIKNEYGVYKNYKACQLVAKVFIDNPDPHNKKYTHHKNKWRFDDYYKNLQWVSQDEHKLLDSGRKIYLYDNINEKLKQFTTIQYLADYLKIEKKLVTNAIYHNKPVFTLKNDIKVFRIKNKIQNGQPIYIAIEDEGKAKENGTTVVTALVFGGLFVWGLLREFKDRAKSDE